MALPTYFAELTLERARKHGSELQGALSAFMDSRPYKIGALHRPETPQGLYYYVAELREIPTDITLQRSFPAENRFSMVNCWKTEKSFYEHARVLRQFLDRARELRQTSSAFPSTKSSTVL